MSVFWPAEKELPLRTETRERDHQQYQYYSLSKGLGAVKQKDLLDVFTRLLASHTIPEVPGVIVGILNSRLQLGVLFEESAVRVILGCSMASIGILIQLARWPLPCCFTYYFFNLHLSFRR